MLRQILMVLAIIGPALFSGCSAASASGPKLIALPPTGGTVTLEPGIYACPAHIPAGTHIIGHGSIVPGEMLADTTWAAVADRTPLPEVRILCPGGLTIAANDFQASNVIFDFQGAGGLTLENVAYGNLIVGIVNSETALTLHAVDANMFGLTVPKAVIYRTKVGLVLRGDCRTICGAVTLNDIGHIDIIQASEHGAIISQYADTNSIGHLWVHMADNATGSGIIFNDQATMAYDADANGNLIGWLDCDGINFTGYCAEFRGYSVGNKVTLGFGIMPDANKVHFDNSFSQTANQVTKVQEVPKAP